MKNALDQLARLHAAVYHFVKLRPQFRSEFPVFVQEYHNPKEEEVPMRQWLTAICAAVTDLVEHCAEDDDDGDMKAAVTAIGVRGMLERTLESMKPRRREGSGFECLTHSDAWQNNFLFKYMMPKSSRPK